MSTVAFSSTSFRRFELAGPRAGHTSMSHWILLSVVVLGLLAYVVVMRAFFQRSREADKQVDYSKIRPWKDDED